MAELDIIKQMPHSLQAEQALLGAIIIDQSNFLKTETLRPEHFYIESHRVIYSAVKDLFVKSRSIDFITLIEAIKENSGITDFDVAKYIKTICDVAAENTNVTEYVRIIQEKSTLRDLINASRDISDMAFSGNGDVRAVVDYAEQTIFNVADDRYRTGLTHISETLKENYNYYQYLAAHPGEDLGVRTGFRDLDNIFVGLGEGDLVLIGARPGVGKTSFALNIALSMGKIYPKKEIAVFSLEMSKQQLVHRLISCEALIDNYTVRKATFTDEQWGEVAMACSTLSATGIYIDDTSDISITEIKSKIRRLKNVGMIVIDYLQLMQSETHKDNRVLEVADITRALKLLAKEMKIPVLLCSQLSRPPKGAKEKRPVLSDLRDSGAIEQDADIVMMLFREDYDTGDSNNSVPSDQQIIECIVGKNRHGQTGTVKFAWHGHYFKFVPIESKYE